MIYKDYEAYVDDTGDEYEELDVSEDERARIIALENEYSALMVESRQEMLRLRDGDSGPEYDFTMPYTREEHEKRLRLIVEWEKDGSAEWKAEYQHLQDLELELQVKRTELWKTFQQERFNRLDGNEEAIISDAVSKTETLMNGWIQEALFRKTIGASFRAMYLRVDGNDIYLDPERTYKASRSLLSIHYDFYKDNPEALEHLDAAVRKIINSNPYVSDKGVLFGQLNEPKRSYRTAAKAAARGALDNIPAYLSIPSLKGFESALSVQTAARSMAFIQPFASETFDKLRFEDGHIYLEGLEELSDAVIRNYITKEIPESIDLPLLCLYYSIILTEISREYDKGTSSLPSNKTVRLPARKLAAVLMGNDYSIGPADIQRLISRTQSFHTLVGILNDAETPYSMPSRYPVLNFEGYDSEDNTISFSSPYLTNLVGKVLKRANIANLKHASHMTYIKTTAARAGNSNIAFENVRIISQGIAQAGSNKEYHIAASTLVERNAFLKDALERDPKHKTQTLKRVFTKTWKMLQEDTSLAELRELPDPNNPRDIPTASNLNEKVFHFPLKQ